MSWRLGDASGDRQTRGEARRPSSAQASKVVIIGLDCAEPSLVFERFADRLPNLTTAPRPGGLGQAPELRPADHRAGLDVDDVQQGPGTLGYYGFRNRADRSYEKMTTATSLAVKEPLLWDRPRPRPARR